MYSYLVYHNLKGIRKSFIDFPIKYTVISLESQHFVCHDYFNPLPRFKNYCEVISTVLETHPSIYTCIS